SGHRSRLNDEDSVRGPHQGQQSTRTAPTGRTHDCKRPLRCTPNDLLPGGGHPHMKTREFITLLGGAAAAWPRAARGQQADVRRRTGVLMNPAADEPEAQARLTAFMQGLQELGWAVRRNLRVDYRWSPVPGDLARLQKDAAELVALRPEVILAGVGATTRALQQAPATLPVVMPQALALRGHGDLDG